MCLHKAKLRKISYTDFLGTDDPLKLQPNTDGWIPLAKDIRGKLGDKAYLLDNYLAFVFEGLHIIFLLEMQRPMEVVPAHCSGRLSGMR